MPKITYIAFDGTETVIDAKEGMSVMQSAVNNGVAGIIAECGGACSCATCHVHVEQEWFDKLPEAQNMEKEMLDFVMSPQPTSPFKLPDQGNRGTGRSGCTYAGIAILKYQRG